MADRAAAFADKQAQAALGRQRVEGGCLGVAAGQGVAEVVEGCAGGGECGLVGGQGLGHVDHQRGIVGRQGLLVGGPVAVGEFRRAAHPFAQATEGLVHLALGEQGREAGGPQGVVAAAPAQPAGLGAVEQAGRVAVAIESAHGGGQAVLESAGGLVAAGAGQPAVAGQAGVKEQRGTPLGGGGLGRHPVGCVGAGRRRPGAVRQDLRGFCG